MTEVTTVKISTQTEVRFQPTLSIIEPMIGERIRPGIAVIETTNPAAVEVPVISSAIQGMAIKTIEPEMMLVSEASCK
jgi:hypothetical protein